MKCKYNLALLVTCLAICFSQGQDTILLKKGTRILALNTYCGDWYIQYYDYGRGNGSDNTNRTVKSISTDLVSSVVSSTGDTLFYKGKVILSHSPSLLEGSGTNVITSQGDTLDPKGKVFSQSPNELLQLSTNDISSSSAIITNASKDRTNIPHLAINPQYRSPAVAFFCSLIPGAGQFYNDEVGRGFAFMIPTAVSIGISYYALASGSYGLSIGTGLVAAVLYVWQSIDAVTTADKKNRCALTITPGTISNTSIGEGEGLGYVPSVSLGFSF